MTTPSTHIVGPTTVDGTTTSVTYDLPLFHGGAKLHFGNITGLTGTIAISFDGTTFTDIISNLGDGTLVAASGTITVADDADLFFDGVGAKKVKFSRTAGDGPVSLVCTFADDLQVASLVRKLILSGIVLGSGSGAIGDVGLEGVSCYSFIADATDELLISATARRVYGVQVFHIDATPVYVKLYDKATAPAETDTPVWRGGVPANATAANGAGANFMFPMPITLTAGLGVRAVTGITDAGDTALTASEVLVNVFWSV